MAPSASAPTSTSPSSPATECATAPSGSSGSGPIAPSPASHTAPSATASPRPVVPRAKTTREVGSSLIRVSSPPEPSNSPWSVATSTCCSYQAISRAVSP